MRHNENTSAKSEEHEQIRFLLSYLHTLPLSPGMKVLFVSCLDLSPWREEFPAEPRVEILTPGSVFFGRNAVQSPDEAVRLDLEDELPTAPACYDFILVLDWLEYCTWPRWGLQKLFFLLKPGGHILMLVKNTPVRWGSWPPKEDWKTQTGPFRQPYDAADSCTADFHQAKKACFPAVPYPWYRVKAWFSFLGLEIRRVEPFKAAVQRFPDKEGRVGFLQKWFNRWILLTQKTPIFYHAVKPKSRTEFFRERICIRSDFSVLFEKHYSRTLRERRQWQQTYPQYGKERPVLLRIPESRTNILVLSPHPDDEVIGCGGLILNLTERGHRVVVVHLTDGSQCHSLRTKPKAYRNRIRLDEAQQAAEAMGAECCLWGIPEKELRPAPEYTQKLCALLENVKPEWILVPFINDPHPDHQTCNHLLQDSLRRILGYQSAGAVIQYEVDELLPANVYLPIDSFMDRKERLLFFYQTGMKPVDYMDSCLWRHAYSSWCYTGTPGFVESFLLLSPGEYLSIKPAGKSLEKTTKEPAG
ncbi:MAG: PIG-L family deacetylase [Anaerohalosphaeraceae bacterium]